VGSIGKIIAGTGLRNMPFCVLLPADALASFACKLNTFRKRVRKTVQTKRLYVGIEWKLK
jgi:hypothetical protein